MHWVFAGNDQRSVIRKLQALQQKMLQGLYAFRRSFVL
jgi:hypothetical protein